MPQTRCQSLFQILHQFALGNLINVACDKFDYPIEKGIRHLRRKILENSIWKYRRNYTYNYTTFLFPHLSWFITSSCFSYLSKENRSPTVVWPSSSSLSTSAFWAARSLALFSRSSKMLLNICNGVFGLNVLI